MFVIKDNGLNIDWEFKWEYRTRMGARPNEMTTVAYAHFLNRDTRERGVVGSYCTQELNKDEARLNLLYQALDILCETYCDTEEKRTAIYKVALERYAEVHSVPKYGTELGPAQRRLQHDLDTFK